MIIGRRCDDRKAAASNHPLGFEKAAGAASIESMSQHGIIVVQGE
jgi:hypothetical protein